MAKLPTLHVVLASWDHEGSTALRVFSDKAVAEQFCRSCHDYNQSKPRTPEVKDTLENDEEWLKWNRKNERWERRHPGGPDVSTADSFIAVQIPFDQTKATP